MWLKLTWCDVRISDDNNLMRGNLGQEAQPLERMVSASPLSEVYDKYSDPQIDPQLADMSNQSFNPSSQPAPSTTQGASYPPGMQMSRGQG